MPPEGTTLGEHSGRDGEDWKWRRAGRLRDGVEGIISRIGPLFSLLPGVLIVRLRLLGRLLGGVGGLMNDGDVGADVFFSFFESMGNVAVGLDLRLLSELAVLMPRFFRFRGFFAGVVGRANSKKAVGELSNELVSVRRDRKSGTKDEGAVLAMGDSGEGPGEGSVTELESMVEIVVVGLESEELDANVDVESRWM